MVQVSQKDRRRGRGCALVLLALVLVSVLVEAQPVAGATVGKARSGAGHSTLHARLGGHAHSTHAPAAAATHEHEQAESATAELSARMFGLPGLDRIKQFFGLRGPRTRPQPSDASDDDAVQGRAKGPDGADGWQKVGPDEPSRMIPDDKQREWVSVRRT